MLITTEPEAAHLRWQLFGQLFFPVATELSLMMPSGVIVGGHCGVEVPK